MPRIVVGSQFGTTEVVPCYKACGREGVGGLGFLLSHPSRKNKYAARIGHPISVALPS